MSREAPAVAGAALRLFENRYLLVLGIAIVVVAGLAALRDMPRIEDPRITNRYPQIITTLPGASAERVEALVTDPIEDSLREMSEIKELRSTSRAGISIINAELQDFIGPGENQQVFSKMRDRLADVTSTLPAGASAPELDDEFSAVAYSVIASLSWPYGGEPEFSVMNRLADDLADRFRSLGGTDNVRVFGAPDEEVSVTVDAAELASLGLSAARVAQAIASADAKLPAGVMRGAERDLYVEVDGELDSVERIRNLPLIDNGSGQVVTVGSVATVRKDWREPPSDIALADGRRGVLVAAQTRRFDALAACFPAGTVSGAPKLRAIEIIHELEPDPRGVYAGAIGYLDFSGNLDTCIAIRTIVMKNDIAYFQAGAGIVADSVPKYEDQECHNKARALSRAIQLAAHLGEN